MVKEIISEFLNIDLQLKTAKSIKFLSIINPDQMNKIQATISYGKGEENFIIVSATLYSEGQNYFKLKAEFCERK